MISVILPTFNERDNIGPLIFEIQKQLHGRHAEIIVVDDDSEDETWSVVEDIQKDRNDIHLIRRKGKLCLTSAISDGIEFSGGDVVVWMDADFSHHPRVINQLLEKVENGYDIAVASRYIPGGGMVVMEQGEDSLLAAILSFIMNYTIQNLLDHSFKDYTSGFIAIRRHVLDGIRLQGDYGEYFIDLIYRAIKKKYKIIEIPYVSGSRRYGVSKTGANFRQYFRRGIKYMLTTIRLRFTRIR